MAKGKKNPARAARRDAKKAETGAEGPQPEKLEVEVEIGPHAQIQFDDLPLPIQKRVRNVFARLKKYPEVSGVKPLKGDYAGSFRIRTGDYRVVFKPESDTKVNVWKIGDRKDVYLD
jgi:mRNA interferase RelE/StbE